MGLCGLLRRRGGIPAESGADAYRMETIPKTCGRHKPDRRLQNAGIAPIGTSHTIGASSASAGATRPLHL
ncbi:hypothetical protein BPORC_1767 [Bifidobacterium porcinum]|nr:hypothetical protein BPORC_1767 [Bifidobacterium porcinum]